MSAILPLVLGAAALYGLHRVAAWAEDRGYLYYRKRRGGSGTLSRAFLEVQSQLEPGKRHVLEEKARQRVEEQDEGDPPRAGREHRS